MSWFSEYVGDPLKALLAKLAGTAEADVKALVGQVAATIPAAPISATAETALVTGLQALLDPAITAAVGEVPAVGAALAPEAVAAGNDGIDYVVEKAVAAINALGAQAKAKLAALSAATTTTTPVAAPAINGPAPAAA